MTWGQRVWLRLVCFWAGHLWEQLSYKVFKCRCCGAWRWEPTQHD